MSRKHLLTLASSFIAGIVERDVQENQNLRFGLPSPAKADNAQSEDHLSGRLP
jgi:hypothetical protein